MTITVRTIIANRIIVVLYMLGSYFVATPLGSFAIRLRPFSLRRVP